MLSKAVKQRIKVNALFRDLQVAEVGPGVNRQQVRKNLAWLLGVLKPGDTYMTIKDTAKQTIAFFTNPYLLSCDGGPDSVTQEGNTVKMTFSYDYGEAVGVLP